MPQRGVRNPVPTSGSKPTGIFSSSGRQKQDGANGPNMSTLSYAHSGGGETKGRGGEASQSKRHQEPNGQRGLK